ncbi:MAG: hypothetical protein Q7S00_04975 [bacterium]|nr:hypothetical protein [bacterium]
MALLLPFLLLASCAETKPVSEALPPPDEAPLPSKSEGLLFPHPDGWKEPTAHGTWMTEFGSPICFQCHKADSEEKTETPTCHSCHVLYPHTEDWDKKENHGKTVIENGKLGCATQCHGTDLAGGLSETPCTQCHKIFPHPTLWADPSQHGQTARTEGIAACQGCHGDDFKKIRGGKTCFDCHKYFPHLPQEVSGTEVSGSTLPWSDENIHGQTVLETEGMSLKECKGCHFEADGETERPLSGKTCSSCHAATAFPYPHPADWAPTTIPTTPYRSTGSMHGPIANTQIGSCKECHGEELNEFPSGSLTCNDCHPSYLQHNGLDTTGTPSWINGHKTYMGVPYKENRKQCRLCHGQDYRGNGNPRKDCHNCHGNSGFPHAGNFKDPEKHGTKALESTPHASNCTGCHGGSDFDGDPASLIPSCFDCHENYPHIADNWVDGARSAHVTTFLQETRPVTLRLLEGRLDLVTIITPPALGGRPTTSPLMRNNSECKKCHGAGYDREIGGGSCQGCHEAHPDGVLHVGDWPKGGQHGRYYSSGGAASGLCQDCHGSGVKFTPSQTRDDLTRGSIEPSCYSCHWAYPHVGYRSEGLDLSWNSSRLPHILYLIGSPLLMDSDGNHPNPSDETTRTKRNAIISAVGATCGGGTEGSCHFEGYRSPPRTSSGDYPTTLCTGYCHQD